MFSFQSFLLYFSHYVNSSCVCFSVLLPSVVSMKMCKRRGLLGRAAFPHVNRLVGLVVKVSASRAEDPGFKSRLRRDFSGVESYQ